MRERSLPPIKIQRPVEDYVLGFMDYEEKVVEISSRLTAKQQSVFFLLLDGMPPAEIARQFHTTRQAIDIRMNGIQKRAKKYLESQNA